MGSDGEFLKGLRLTHPRKKVSEPWDLCRGKDVFRDWRLLSGELNVVSMCHWAPNCSTFSRARERPIPGVSNPPRPLRSEEHPEGIEEEVSRLPRAKRQKLEDDTSMARMAAERSLQFHRSGKRFSLEHPGNSLARHLDCWKELEAEPGVFSTRYHACMFAPCKRRKVQVLIHNVPELDEAMGRACTRPGGGVQPNR